MSLAAIGERGFKIAIISSIDLDHCPCLHDFSLELKSQGQVATRVPHTSICICTHILLLSYMG
jgi:hypothetical protein